MNEVPTLLAGAPDTVARALTEAARGLADYVALEDPDGLDGLTAPEAALALLNGELSLGCRFFWWPRTSGAYELAVELDGGFSNGPVGVFATVDRGGRVWFRGGSAAAAVVEATANF